MLLVLLMAFAMLITVVPDVSVVQGEEVPVKGQIPAGKTPNATTSTVCSLSARPSIVGLGQIILVNAWLNPAVTRDRVIKTFIFTITAPDGEVITFEQDAEPATAATWFEYVLDQVGEWKLKAEFTGCYFNGTTDEATQSAYYRPSTSKEVTVTCQEEMNPSWPPSQIPNDYWTRPVAFAHREWWPFLGNFPANGYDASIDPDWNTRYPNTNPRWSSQHGFTPWVQSPHSSHIVWLDINQPAGIVGGQAGQGGNTVGRDLSTSPLLSTLAYGGRGYRTVIKPMPALINGTIRNNPTNVWQCFDIRTGKVYWEQTDVQIPTFIEYSVSTTTAAGSAGAVTASLVYLSSSRMVKYNPVTGAVTANVSVPFRGTYYMNEHVLSVQNLGSSIPVEQRYRLINWTTAGTTNDFAQRIISNTSYARSSLPSAIDWNVGLGGQASGVTRAGIMSAVTVTGFNLWTGETLWTQTIEEATLYSGSCTVADHGKIAFLLSRIGDKMGAYMAYDLATGNLAWTSEVMPYPWSSTAFGAYGVASAYGLIIHPGYAGLTAINWTNGKIAWNYHKYALAPFESPYTDENGTEVYSFNSGVRIADGVVYAYNCEHTTTFPRTRGWSTVAVDIMTGEELWSIQMPGNAAFGNNPDLGAIADGYMSMETDIGYFVVFGKGKSTTSITTPDIVLTKGQGVVIKGAVLDLSPAQAGTPCVSKESMTLQMEYLHLQMPVAGLWQNETITGVPVSLDVVDPNGNSYNIGTVTTDGYSGTFGYTWIPEIPGQYTVTATFLGDDSYGSSFATTYIAVVEAPDESVTPTQTPLTMPPFEMYTVGSAVAIIIAIAIAVLLLRKRP